MSGMFLTDEELRELSRKRRSDAQGRALRAMGIEHRIRPDGSVAVLRAHVEDLLGGTSSASRSKVKSHEPDWSAVHAKA